MDKILIKAVRG